LEEQQGEFRAFCTRLECTERVLGQEELLRRSCYANRQVNICVKDRGRAQRRLVSQVQIQLKIVASQ
jgi:hypothetical protein